MIRNNAARVEIGVARSGQYVFIVNVTTAGAVAAMITRGPT